MKSFILLLGTLLSLSAKAQVGSVAVFPIPVPGYANTDVYNNSWRGNGNVCHVGMYSVNNQLLQTFRAWDCANAIAKCEQDLAYRHRNNRNLYARCVITNNGGGRPQPYPPRNPRPYPPRNPPPRNGNWACTAYDNGTEEHFGGHVGYGRNQFEASNNAIRICRLSHGNCYVTSCN